jgi:hypothetical protein
LPQPLASPVTLRTLGRTSSTTGSCAAPGRAAGPRLVGHLQVGEDLGEAPLVDEVAELAQEAAARVGDEAVDGRHDRRAPHLRRELGVGRGGHRRPTSQATSSRLSTLTSAPPAASRRRAERQVSRRRSAPPTTSPAPARAWREEDDRQADGRAGEADERVELGDARRDPRAEHAAAEEADERQHPDDEALPVADSANRTAATTSTRSSATTSRPPVTPAT